MKRYVLFVLVVFSFALPILAKDRNITLLDDPDREKIPVSLVKKLLKTKSCQENACFEPRFLKTTLVAYSPQGVNLYKTITIWTIFDKERKKKKVLITLKWLSQYLDYATWNNPLFAYQDYYFYESGIPSEIKSFKTIVRGKRGSIGKNVTSEELRKFISELEPPSY